MKNKIFQGYKTIGKLILVMAALAAIFATMRAGRRRHYRSRLNRKPLKLNKKKYPHILMCGVIDSQ